MAWKFKIQISSTQKNDVLTKWDYLIGCSRENKNLSHSHRFNDDESIAVSFHFSFHTIKPKQPRRK